MARRFTEKTLVIASHNQGKVVEIQALLAPFNVTIRSCADFYKEEPEEDGDTFDANARIKSVYCAEKTGLPSLADDSGIVVPALDGQPGIYSARWGGEKKDFVMAMHRIRDELTARGKTPEGQKAYFVCVLALTWPDGHTESFEGRVHGRLTFPMRGTHGHGYDPIFVPESGTQTFAEMDQSQKNGISHRANAFRLLVEGCFA